MEKFKKELTELINRNSIENKLDIPDFLLAEIICEVIKVVGPKIKEVLDWHDCNSVCHPKKGSLEMETAIEKTVVVTLKLNEGEALWLKSLVQNALVAAPEGYKEKRSDAEMRKRFFDAIPIERF